MSKIEVNTVEPQCGTTLTLGGSGDTVALGTGASQTGFGREGTVNWVTTKKTTGFTAVSGNGYFCDTAASGAFTLTLPTSPSAGDIVGFKDYNGNFATANLTIGRGGQPINGANVVDPVIQTAGASIFLVYVDASQGWVATQDDSSIFSGDNYIIATGGTESTSGDYKIHSFTGPGTFTVCSASATAGNNIVDYLVVAGGGGGGSGCGSGGGGGAGGLRFFANTTNNPQSGPGSPRNGYGSPTPSGTQITVTATGYPITVGGGGTAGPGASAPGKGGQGVDSVFSTITSAGGGYARGGNEPGPPTNGNPGGSGGSATRDRGTGGTGNTPPTTPSQGSNAGASTSNTLSGGGGGGAMAVGGDTINTPGGSAGTGGVGGAGAGLTGFGTGNGECSSCVQYFAGGGGGGSFNCSTDVAVGPPTEADGGIGGGGPGAMSPSHPGSYSAPASPANKQWGVEGTANTGGGGGGGGESSTVGRPNNDADGGAGGSGIVVIRYKYK